MRRENVIGSQCEPVHAAPPRQLAQQEILHDANALLKRRGLGDAGPKRVYRISQDRTSLEFLIDEVSGRGLEKLRETSRLEEYRKRFHAFRHYQVGAGTGLVSDHGCGENT